MLAPTPYQSPPEAGCGRALDTHSLVTNSFHHQAIRDLAAGLMVTAQADDGVIEGVEGLTNEGWLLAVQWHPEEFHLERDSPDQRLFRALVKATAPRSHGVHGDNTVVFSVFFVSPWLAGKVSAV